MNQDDTALREAIVDAAERIRAGTGAPVSTAFDELVPVDTAGSHGAAHAMGFIEGAALALGVTPIELLDEYGLSDQP